MKGVISFFFHAQGLKVYFTKKKTFFLYRTPFFYKANIHIICDRGVVKEAKYSSQQKNFLALDARIRNILLLFLEFKYRKIFSSGGKGNPFKPKNIYQKQFLIKLKKLYFS